MKRLLAVIAFVATTVSPIDAQTPNTAARHPIEVFFMSGIASFNAHDLDAFTQQFAPDIEMYTPTGWLRGHESVRARFAQTFQQFPSVRMEIDDLRVREVAPGTVIADFSWRVYPMGKGPAFHGVGTGVYVNRNGKWAEVLEHETVVKTEAQRVPPRVP
jgi:uncharacterized protein (TIGR02246 family)